MTTRPRVVLLHGVQSSKSTWWRVGADLTDLGYDVLALDLPGHGSRAAEGTPTLATMAADVLARLDGVPVDLLVGHSLGGLVSLILATARPDMIKSVLAEDPPGLGPDLDPADVADNIEREFSWAHSDPAAMTSDVHRRNPLWAPADVDHDVANLRAIDLAAVTGFLRTAPHWDLPAMVADCPVPVHLLLARGIGSAVTGSVRSRLLSQVDPTTVTEVDSSHSIHRDRPGVWVGTVVRLLSPPMS